MCNCCCQVTSICIQTLLQCCSKLLEAAPVEDRETPSKKEEEWWHPQPNEITCIDLVMVILSSENCPSPVDLFKEYNECQLVIQHHWWELHGDICTCMELWSMPKWSSYTKHQGTSSLHTVSLASAIRSANCSDVTSFPCSSSSTNHSFADIKRITYSPSLAICALTSLHILKSAVVLDLLCVLKCDVLYTNASCFAYCDHAHGKCPCRAWQASPNGFFLHTNFAWACCTNHDAGAGRWAYYNPTIMRSFHWSKKKEKKTDNADTGNLQALFLIDSWFLSAPKDSSTFPESNLNSNKSAD